MLTIVFMFILITILAFTLVGLLIVALKNQLRATRVIEIGGFVLFVATISWTIIHDLTNDMSSENDSYVINAKLDMLWNNQLLLSQGEHDDLIEYQQEASAQWLNLKEQSKEFKDQEEIVKKIHAYLLAFSAMLVAIGRGRQLIFGTHEDKVPK